MSGVRTASRSAEATRNSLLNTDGGFATAGLMFGGGKTTPGR